MRVRPHTVALLILALLFGQVAAFAHAASHVVQDIRSGQGLPHGDCDDCLAQAALGAAPPSSPSVLSLDGAPCLAFVAQAGTPRAESRAVYQSRAPPATFA